MRSDLRKKIGNSNEYYKKFWRENFPNAIEIAHIKSVKQIKNEYMQEKDTNTKSKLLLEIKDLNNCLPIPCQVHQNYDSNNITWNTQGQMLIKRGFKLDCWLEKCLKTYKNILESRNTIAMRKFIEDHNKFEIKDLKFEML